MPWLEITNGVGPFSFVSLCFFPSSLPSTLPSFPPSFYPHALRTRPSIIARERSERRQSWVKVRRGGYAAPNGLCHKLTQPPTQRQRAKRCLGPVGAGERGHGTLKSCLNNEMNFKKKFVLAGRRKGMFAIAIYQDPLPNSLADSSRYRTLLTLS